LNHRKQPRQYFTQTVAQIFTKLSKRILPAVTLDLEHSSQLD
jgi:hypothetical protein